MEVREAESFETEFEPRVLEASELSLVAGGFYSACTCDTTSVCHIDGTNDGD